MSQNYQVNTSLKDFSVEPLCVYGLAERQRDNETIIKSSLILQWNYNFDPAYSQICVVYYLIEIWGIFNSKKLSSFPHLEINKSSNSVEFSGKWDFSSEL
jgi:hypothetical protein